MEPQHRQGTGLSAAAGHKTRPAPPLLNGKVVLFALCSRKAENVVTARENKLGPLEKKNYRPVSNLKSVSKVIELIVNKQVLNSNNLLPESQHGFRGKRSTFSAVATMHELWIKN